MVSEIFSVRNFQHLISKKNLLMGKPVADPFVVAKAKVLQGTVVTQERYKPNGAKIPNVCEHFGVKHLALEGFMQDQGWSF